MPRTTLADVASDYVRKHQHERQCRQLDSNSRVTLTVIQNQWAKLAGQEPMTIFDAPEVVIRSIETTQRGHELFDRTKESNGVVYYGLKDEREKCRAPLKPSRKSSSYWRTIQRITDIGVPVGTYPTTGTP